MFGHSHPSRPLGGRHDRAPFIGRLSAYNSIDASGLRPWEHEIMLIGILADTHDHLDNTRLLVERFNDAGCDLVLHAGDFVSPLVVTPLRRLECKMLAVWGDNDANRRAIAGQLRVVGSVHEPPLETELPDGTPLLMAHRPIERTLLQRAGASLGERADEASGGRQPAGTRERRVSARWYRGADAPRSPTAHSPTGVLAVQAHTHHPGMKRYGELLLLNPGEACGWVTGQATAAFYETRTGEATIFDVADGRPIQTSRPF